MRTGTIIELYYLGRWDEALAIAAEEEAEGLTGIARLQSLAVALVHCERGNLESAQAVVSDDELRSSENPQARAGYSMVRAHVLRTAGRPAEALAAAEQSLAVLGELPLSDSAIKSGLVEAVEAALALGDLDRAEELLAIPAALDPGQLTPLLQANAARLGARLQAARGGRDGVEDRFRSAAALFREFGLVFHLAVTQLEQGEWLAIEGRADEAQPLLAEARETFERLQATPWLERTGRTDFVLLQH
jgi:hypothetical protein